GALVRAGCVLVQPARADAHHRRDLAARRPRRHHPGGPGRFENDGLRYPAGVTTTTARQSLWLEALPDDGFPVVQAGEKFDVAVIGGGITGMTTALLLKQAGLRVA